MIPPSSLFNWAPSVADIPPKSAGYLPPKLARGDPVTVHPEGLKAAGLPPECGTGVVGDLWIESGVVRALVGQPGSWAAIDVRYLTREE